jgi:hypothetical protein
LSLLTRLLQEIDSEAQSQRTQITLPPSNTAEIPEDSISSIIGKVNTELEPEEENEGFRAKIFPQPLSPPLSGDFGTASPIQPSSPTSTATSTSVSSSTPVLHYVDKRAELEQIDVEGELGNYIMHLYLTLTEEAELQSKCPVCNQPLGEDAQKCRFLSCIRSVHKLCATTKNSMVYCCKQHAKPKNSI